MPQYASKSVYVFKMSWKWPISAPRSPSFSFWGCKPPKMNFFKKFFLNLHNRPKWHPKKDLPVFSEDRPYKKNDERYNRPLSLPRSVSKLFPPYVMFVDPHSTSNTFTKVFKYVVIMIAVPNNDNWFDRWKHSNIFCLQEN